MFFNLNSLNLKKKIKKIRFLIINSFRIFFSELIISFWLILSGLWINWMSFNYLAQIHLYFFIIGVVSNFATPRISCVWWGMPMRCRLIISIVIRRWVILKIGSTIETANCVIILKYGFIVLISVTNFPIF